MGVESNIIKNVEKYRLKLVKVGTVSLTSTPDTTTVRSVNHNLGYVPHAQVYLTNGILYQSIPSYIAANFDGSVINFQQYIDFTVTDTAINIQYYDALSSTFTVTVKYFLYRIIVE